MEQDVNLARGYSQNGEADEAEDLNAKSGVVVASDDDDKEVSANLRDEMLISRALDKSACHAEEEDGNISVPMCI